MIPCVKTNYLKVIGNNERKAAFTRVPQIDQRGRINEIEFNGIQRLNDTVYTIPQK
jgi:hypothetical protein